MGPPPAGDAVLLAAMEELRTCETPAHRCLDCKRSDRAASDPLAEERALERVLLSAAAAGVQRGWARWRLFCEVLEASAPLEDELTIVHRELRRSHGMLQATLQQQQQQRAR